MCACGRVGMLYIALCSGVDVKYITVLNLHQYTSVSIYMQGMSLQNAHSVILIYMSCRVPVYMDPIPIQQTSYWLYDAMSATEASQERGREATNRDVTM